MKHYLDFDVYKWCSCNFCSPLATLLLSVNEFNIVSAALVTNGSTCKTVVPVALRILIDSLSLSFLANGAICHSSAAAYTLRIWFQVWLLDHYQFGLHYKVFSSIWIQQTNSKLQHWFSVIHVIKHIFLQHI